MSGRLGKESRSLGLEQRFRRIEDAIDASSSGSGGLTPREGDVDLDESGTPTVSGLSLNPGLRGLAVRWNDAGVPQADFDFYDVQFATNSSFTAGVVTAKTKDLQYTFSEGDSNSPYFIRVRVS